jgi:hypothetical protein
MLTLGAVARPALAANWAARMMDGDEIAQRVRRMCEAGWLPRADEDVRVRRSIGSGQQCDICGEPIERNVVTMMLRVTRQQVERICRLHARCFHAWRQHCQANG